RARSRFAVLAVFRTDRTKPAAGAVQLARVLSDFRRVARRVRGRERLDFPTGRSTQHADHRPNLGRRSVHLWTPAGPPGMARHEIGRPRRKKANAQTPRPPDRHTIPRSARIEL